MYAKRDGVGGEAYGIFAFFARYQVAKIISEHGAAYTNSCSCCYILPMVAVASDAVGSCQSSYSIPCYAYPLGSMLILLI